ncbi:hypothetical protein CU254_41130 (plasmid) [Amycolatopsis sp. AA4]|uniref:hypothetical protein n=1 Tax=Actinomycetes TaxID=1760 RepID=UPI0001B56167|nr:MULTISPECIES: hypothetical protein [Actinomycetes]ATY16997.1 hypothetical protein CU254_41130 [Amycolatopsis sp. AA4]
MCPSSPDAVADLDVIAWIGAHPDDGSDLAELIVCPRLASDAKGMPVVAAALGLIPVKSAPPPVVARGRARILLEGTGARLLYGRDGVLSHPGSGEWVRAAEHHGFALVVCAREPVSGGLEQFVDSLFARPDRLYFGKVLLGERADDACAEPKANTVEVVEGGIAELAAMLPVTEEDMARKSQLTGPVLQFFREHAEPGRTYAMQEIGAATGIGPEDAFALMHCLNMLVELGVLEAGPPAGGHGPTWRRA